MPLRPGSGCLSPICKNAHSARRRRNCRDGFRLHKVHKPVGKTTRTNATRIDRQTAITSEGLRHLHDAHTALMFGVLVHLPTNWLAHGAVIGQQQLKITKTSEIQQESYTHHRVLDALDSSTSLLLMLRTWLRRTWPTTAPWHTSTLSQMSSSADAAAAPQTYQPPS